MRSQSLLMYLILASCGSSGNPCAEEEVQCSDRCVPIGTSCVDSGSRDTGLDGAAGDAGGDTDAGDAGAATDTGPDAAEDSCGEPDVSSFCQGDTLRFCGGRAPQDCAAEGIRCLEFTHEGTGRADCFGLSERPCSPADVDEESGVGARCDGAEAVNCRRDSFTGLHRATFRSCDRLEDGEGVCVLHSEEDPPFAACDIPSLELCDPSTYFGHCTPDGGFLRCDSGLRRVVQRACDSGRCFENAASHDARARLCLPADAIAMGDVSPSSEWLECVGAGSVRERRFGFVYVRECPAVFGSDGARRPQACYDLGDRIVCRAPGLMMCEPATTPPVCVDGMNRQWCDGLLMDQACTIFTNDGPSLLPVPCEAGECLQGRCLSGDDTCLFHSGGDSDYILRCEILPFVTPETGVARSVEHCPAGCDQPLLPSLMPDGPARCL